MCNQDDAHDVEIYPDKKLRTQVNFDERYFLINIFWLKHFQVITNCKSCHSQVFFVKTVLKITQISRRTFPVSENSLVI